MEENRHFLKKEERNLPTRKQRKQRKKDRKDRESKKK
jgi:hypothetical protein